MELAWVLGVVVASILFLGHRRYNLATADGWKCAISAVRDGLAAIFVARQSSPSLDAEILPESPPKLNRGNIRPIEGEEDDPEILGPEIHQFPGYPEPTTRFEEFNWRLFIHRVDGAGERDAAGESPRSWPRTTLDDFPTRLALSRDQLLEEIHTRLRPAYPVILDGYGWWQGASERLEYDDTYSDVVVRSYLRLPAEIRPVVISSPVSGGGLTLLRYGFEPLELPKKTLEPLMGASLDYLFEALTGSRPQWMWFSVARMRKAVMQADRETQAAIARINAEHEAALAVVTQKERRAAELRSANRFTALWEIPVEIELDPEPGEDPPIDLTVAQDDQEAPAGDVEPDAAEEAAIPSSDTPKAHKETGSSAAREEAP